MGLQGTTVLVTPHCWSSWNLPLKGADPNPISSFPLGFPSLLLLSSNSTLVKHNAPHSQGPGTAPDFWEGVCGLFPPRGYPRAVHCCSPQGPGPRLPFLAKPVVTVGRAQCAQLDTKLRWWGRWAFLVGCASVSGTCPLHQNSASIFRIGSSGVKPAR